MLKIARNECHQLLQQNMIKELEAYLKIFEERLEELNNLKIKDQDLMLENYENIEHIEEWPSKHESGVQENDAPTEELYRRIKELKEIENKWRKAEEDQIDEEHLQRRYDEEKQLETMKIELRQTFKQKNEGNSGKQLRQNPVKVKLPTLTNSKF